MSFLYYLTTFLGSLLLFTIQLIVGKRLLPWYGGVATVWTTAMLFFMTTLFFGYLYVNFISKLSKPLQVKIHLLLAVLSLATTILSYNQHSSLIFHLFADNISSSISPIVQITLLILFSVGLPFFLLATTSTILQHWFSIIRPKKSPYPLYVVSNIGSLLGLLTYPFFVEPSFPVHIQEDIWLALFAIYTLLILHLSGSFSHYQGKSVLPSVATTKRPFLRTFLFWILLSTTSNTSLLATTSYITQSISPTPLLWILPLAIFLLSFIIAFSNINWYSRKFHTTLLLLSLLAATLVSSGRIQFSFGTNLSILLGSLAMICLVVHAELYRSRPFPQNLVPFYVSISFGGVIASIFCAVISPNLFPDLWEIPASLALATFTGFIIMIQDKDGYSLHTQRFLLATSILILIITRFQYMFNNNGLNPQITPVQKTRNFYGVNRIFDDSSDPNNHTRSLENGAILHGFQYISGDMIFEPTTYYDRQSGIGKAIEMSDKRTINHPLRIGVIGLGVGTLAAYCQPGDYFRFYEINPDIIKFSEEYFTFISKCRQNGNTVDIVSGDARLLLQQEHSSGDLQEFDFLIVDAFTDDAIPVHLLTKEAITLFLSHLSDSGLLAFHISNKYLQLHKVLDTATYSLNLTSHAHLDHNSDWYFISPSSIPNVEKNFFAPEPDQTIKLWTDDYNNTFQIIR